MFQFGTYKFFIFIQNIRKRSDLEKKFNDTTKRTDSIRVVYVFKF